MNSLSNFLRSLKLTYTTYNLIHSEKLKHNRSPYKQSGIQKFLFQSISSKDFKSLPVGDIPWMDRNVSREEIKARIEKTNFDDKTKVALSNWKNSGYMILPGFFSGEVADEINGEIEQKLGDGSLSFCLGNKIQFANRKSEIIQGIIKQKKLTDVLEFILGRKVLPFQTINFLSGSEQLAHSDSIHMTTYPLGYLIAIWVALEHIDIDCGPLHYYPGSHKLPYLLNAGYERGGNIMTVGADENYLKYEERIGGIIREQKIEKKIFTAEKGDVLIWHANLIHGGEPIARKGSSRKSMVVHYFAEDVVKYHEITERPALIG